MEPALWFCDCYADAAILLFSESILNSNDLYIKTDTLIQAEFHT